MRTVKNIMDSKPKAFNIISPGTLVIDALHQLNSVNLSYLIVMDGNQYKGIFCERDYTRNVILKGRASNTTRVEEVMTVDLPMVELSDTVEHCMNVMNTHKARYLLVFHDQQFLGVVTIHDLLRQVISGKADVFDDLAQKLIDQEEGGGKIY
ncbi:MAG TPA: CBS domain-containing protein [Chitinophagaceae bacterium]|nr:CBS domain-containing protein [Chitinophagaceae bacterium]